ncbi:hypothetical protein [Microbacterium candidum]|uniref:Uncharacterized protein n=1 Tax=Microbacterium candidum TaxID=3041922 RepID=A0ABT7MUM3_9MICO|nr:hypothetical protein [Microbacterium sp. ASV49]MDL9978123.1 hypothetical protein [Microbacterium sp. ASV49]
MDSVRTADPALAQELHRIPGRTRRPGWRLPVLDVICIAATIALFALVALVAKAVEKIR